MANDHHKGDELITINEAARLAGSSPWRIRKLAQRGHVKSALGRLVSRRDVLAWVEAQRPAKGKRPRSAP